MIHGSTIVARNYLAQAQVLVDSFRAHHPDGTFHVLLVDEPGTARPQVRGADVLMLDEIGLPPGTLSRMGVAYELIELATAVKPWLLASLLDRHSDHAVYFDPDLSIERRIEELPGLARNHSVVLTPHLTEPMPRDEHHPHEQILLMSGIYNLGFIGVGDTEEARRMLRWWQERLRTDAFVSFETGFFTDQRWIDFVPGLFEHYIVTDPSWNVAYWNLATRPLTRDAEGDVLVAGHPLTFTHMSGYSPRTPWLLSKHQGASPRVLLSENPVLRELCDDYGARLLEAGFEDRQTDFVAPFTSYQGIELSRTVKQLVRDELRAQAIGKGTGLGWPDSPGADLVEWLADPLPEDHATLPNLGRFLTHVYLARPDLQDAYPEVRHGDLESFLKWVEDFGIREMNVPHEVLRRTREHWRSLRDIDAPGGSIRTRTIPGVELVGFLSADLGLGETARQFVASLENANVPLSTRTYTRTSSRLGVRWVDRPAPSDSRYDTVLLCVNADITPIVAQDLGPAFFQDRYVIGLWFWELSKWPADMVNPALEHLDEVWVCSEFNARSLRRLTDKPVIVVPHPAHAPRESHVRIPEIDDGVFSFLFAFDHFSAVERKNPVGLIDAFTRAFPTEGEARLVIKSINGAKCLPDRERVRYAAGGRSDVVLIERYLDRDELDGLMWNCDCYVSLHRSEGFGQTLAETMAIGKPVIATRYSGNRTFMNRRNSLLVDQELVPVPPGSGPYPSDQGYTWAQPDLDQAAALMRQVFEDVELRRTVGSAARRYIRRHHSTKALGRIARERLTQIREEQVPHGLADQARLMAGSLRQRARDVLNRS